MAWNQLVVDNTVDVRHQLGVDLAFVSTSPTTIGLLFFNLCKNALHISAFGIFYLDIDRPFNRNDKVDGGIFVTRINVELLVNFVGYGRRWG